MNDSYLAWLWLAIGIHVLVTVALAVFFVRVRKCDFFSPAIQFLLFYTLFVLPLPIRMAMTNEIAGDVTSHLPQLRPYMLVSVVLCTLGLPFFALGYQSKLAGALARVTPRPPSGRSDMSVSAFVLIAGLSLTLIALLARDSGGVLNFLLLGYDASAQMFGRGYLAAGFPWFFVGTLFLLYRYVRSRSRVVLIAFFSLLLGQMAAQLVLGARSQVMYYALTVAIFYHYAVHRLSMKQVLAIGAVGFVCLNLWGLLRGSNYRSVNDLVRTVTEDVVQSHATGTFRENWAYTLTQGEFVVPFETMPQMIKSAGDEIPFEWGWTYLRAPLFFIPSAIFPERPQALANWYMERFYGGGYGENEGRQFFFLAEAYLNFGPAGIPLLMLIWGLALGFLDKYRQLSGNAPGIVLMFALIVAFIPRGIAGDAVTMLVGVPEQVFAIALFGIFISTGFRPWRVNARYRQTMPATLTGS